MSGTLTRQTVRRSRLDTMRRPEGDLFTLDVVAQLFGVELKTVYNALSRHRDSLDPPTYWRHRHPRLLRVLSERDMEVLRSVFRLRVRRRSPER
jgi:hypothetical protein